MTRRGALVRCERPDTGCSRCLPLATAAHAVIAAWTDSMDADDDGSSFEALGDAIADLSAAVTRKERQ